VASWVWWSGYLPPEIPTSEVLSLKKTWFFFNYANVDVRELYLLIHPRAPFLSLELLKNEDA
jgi:hypothetical protein